MEQHLNSVTIGGVLVSTPNVTSTPSGKTISNIQIDSIQIRRFRDSSQVRRTRIQVTAWGLLAELSRNWNAGDQIIANGELKSRSYISKGAAKTVLEVSAKQITHIPNEENTESVQVAQAFSS